MLSASDAEDVLQEALLAALKGASSYRPEARAGGWLWGSPIARPRCCFAARARRRAKAKHSECLGT